MEIYSHDCDCYIRCALLKQSFCILYPPVVRQKLPDAHKQGMKVAFVLCLQHLICRKIILLLYMEVPFSCCGK